MRQVLAVLAVVALLAGCATGEPASTEQLRLVGSDEPTTPGIYTGERGKWVILGL
jgi:hypothetical protein